MFRSVADFKGLGTFLEQRSHVTNHDVPYKQRKGICTGLSAREGAQTKVTQQAYDNLASVGDAAGFSS